MARKQGALVAAQLLHRQLEAVGGGGHYEGVAHVGGPDMADDPYYFVE